MEASEEARLRDDDFEDEACTDGSVLRRVCLKAGLLYERLLADSAWNALARSATLMPPTMELRLTGDLADMLLDGNEKRDVSEAFGVRSGDAGRSAAILGRL